MGSSTGSLQGSTGGFARWGPGDYLDMMNDMRRIQPSGPAEAADARNAAGVTHRAALWLTAGFWAVYFLITTIRMAIIGAPEQGGLALRRLVVILFAIGFTFLLHLLLRRVGHWRTRKLLPLAFAASLPLALAYASVNMAVFEYTKLPAVEAWEAAMMAGKPGRTEHSALAKIAFTSAEWYFFCCCWSVMWVAVNYGRRAVAAEQKAARYAQAAQSAELRALRYQVNPHFLFNTLNSLSSLVMVGRNEQAEAMILNLSAFFRASLTGDPAGDSTVADEVALQRRYLEIEAVRFAGRLKPEFDVPPETEGLMVPGFILQPLVENAIRYAVAPSKQPVTLAVRVRKRVGRLELIVEDDGEGLPAAGGTGVGLRNVRDRLMARYGLAAVLAAGPKPSGGYRALISLPLEG